MPFKFLPMPSRSLLNEKYICDPETGAVVHRMSGKNALQTSQKSCYRISINGVVYLAHRVIWYMCTDGPMAEEVDHINGDRFDNRIVNLRPASHGENLRNQKIGKGNTSGFKGVCWHKQSRKWRALIKKNGKQIQIGSFDDPAIAYVAYVDAAKRLHGEFANDGHGPI